MSEDTLMTPNGGMLLCYGPTLFIPRKHKAAAPTAKPRYEANIIVGTALQTSPEYKSIASAVQAAGLEVFGEVKMKDKAWFGKDGKIKLPIHDYDEGEPGDKVIRAWSYDPVEVVDNLMQDVTVQSAVWSGQLARMVVNAKAFNKGNPCICLFLNGVQITKQNMPKLPGGSGSVSAKKAFSVVEEEGGSTLGGETDEDLPF